jgi:hypothetical protein
MYIVLTSILLLTVLRWVAGRYLRSKGQVRLEAPSAEPLPSSTGDLSMWKALRQELLAWLLVASVLGALFLLALFYVHFFGSFRPVHEWGT